VRVMWCVNSEQRHATCNAAARCSLARFRDYVTQLAGQEWISLQQL
jgi:hypothetical protein